MQNGSQPLEQMINGAFIPALPDADSSQILGSGRISGIVGEGGMAVVYEIWNEQLGIKRAVKVLKPNYSAENRSRFDTEVKLTAQLDHPNIIRVHSVGDWNGLPFIEMELVDGFSLAQLLQEANALPLEVALSIALVVSRALAYTHQQDFELEGRCINGLLHRDLKPENILISHKGKVRLTDFGIATPISVSLHTMDGNIVGSMQYMAPEQLKGKEIDTRADIFSFGCVLYEMLTGYKTFADRNVADLVPKRLANEYDPLSNYKLLIPARLNRLVLRCLQYDPRRRPHSMQQISDELAKILGAMSDKPCQKIIADFVMRPQPRAQFVQMQQSSPARKPLTVAAWVAAVLIVAFPGRYLVQGIASALTQRSNSTQALAPVIPLQATYQGDAELTVDTLSCPFGVLDSLERLHGSKSLLTLMRLEQERGMYLSSLRLAKRLTPAQAVSVSAVVLRMRALAWAGKLDVDFFEQNAIDDAEFGLFQAEYERMAGNFPGALAALERFANSGAAMADVEDIRRRAQVCKGRVLLQMMTRESSEQRKQLALDTWQNVKKLYGGQKNHAFYREALRACKRLASS